MDCQQDPPDPARPSGFSSPARVYRPMLKRERPSSVSCTYDQLNKRFCRSKSPVAPHLLCLHCNVVGHAWSQCDAMCLQCWNTHPRKRCANLSFDNYTPGPFTLLNTSDSVGTGEPELLVKKEPMCGIGGLINLNASLMEGVNAERQAMIAATPEPLPEPSEALAVEDGGLQGTGTNAMPLGSFKPHLSRRNLAQTHSSNNLHRQKMEHSKYLKRWQALELQLRSVVQSAENPNLATNNGRDRAAVLEAVDQALDILRPSILR
ncbi:hypothetical protein AC578_1584 [Pseudocercospora eumusae]|uniref:Uncharacterized protein n=1 Tax=Pseudocercospora eumusae TaxID=321146 RepID=A0A139HM58_9PEZI|nr:hypothetical protein AC578_1584 [Pseudocercospora eumusae]